MKNKQWSVEEIQILNSRYGKDGEIVLGQLFNRSPISVRHKANRLGLTRDASVNEEYFKKWTNNMSYTLGYIFADGNISKNHYMLRLRCNTKDESVLLSIHKEMSSQHAIGRRSARKSKTGVNSGPVTYSNIASIALVKSLITLGVFPAKSHLDLDFPNIPKEFLPHFVRGYFDGDGCISMKQGKYHTITIIGTKRFIEKMQEQICHATSISKKPIYHKNNQYYLVWGHREDVRLFTNFIYPKGEYISLKRKRNKLESVFALPTNKTPKTYNQEGKKVLGQTQISDSFARDAAV